MVGKDNWRGFLDAIYSKWCLFLPILSPFLHSHSFCRHPSPPTPHLLAKSYLSSLSFPFFSSSILYSNVKYGLTSSVWLRGRLPVNCKFWPTLQFIWNGKSGKAIYWKWGGSLNFPPLKKVCVFSSHGGGVSAEQNLIEMSALCFNEKVQFWETRRALIRDFISVKEVLGNAWNIVVHWGNCMLSMKFRVAFTAPYYFHTSEAVTYIRSTLHLLIAN